MKHFPVFMAVDGRRVIVSGAGETAAAKLRLLLKTSAHIAVYGDDICTDVQNWADDGSIFLTPRPIVYGEAVCAAFVYCANDDLQEDLRVCEIARACAAPFNIVDNLQDSQFITPALVDRDPLTVAIGTEGAAPMLARKVKAELEEQLPQSLGTLARIGQAFRPHADILPMGRIRRTFWAKYYNGIGTKALEDGEDAVEQALWTLLKEVQDTPKEEKGHVSLIGCGPGDPELLTLKARRLIHEADVVVYDRLVNPVLLELARREAILIEVGKTPYGQAWKQVDINAVLVKHGHCNHHVARLKSGDPSIFGRLDEEMDALDAAGIPFDVIPGITSAAAAAASIKASLTKRNRNSAVTLLTGHDVAGFADQDWRTLARPGATAAIYMGMRAARFVQGRLLIHGADSTTPVTVVENASRPEQRVASGILGELPEVIQRHDLTGPAIIFLGLAPREAATAVLDIEIDTSHKTERVLSHVPQEHILGL